MKGVILLAFVIIILGFRPADNKVIWQLGENNNSGSEFALAPNGYDKFIENDFGWESGRHFVQIQK